MPEALAQVKREFGVDAVILGTRTVDRTGIGGLIRGRLVEITAGPAGLASPAPRISPASTPAAANRSGGTEKELKTAATADPWSREYYQQLVQAEVGVELAQRIVRDAALAVSKSGKKPCSESLRCALHAEVAKLVPAATSTELRGIKPKRLALVGPAGAGKTTTVAKIAAQFRLRHAMRVAALSLDTMRMGASESLVRYADAIDVPVAVAQTGSEVREKIRGLGEFDILLIDTPGVGWRDQGRFARLAALLRAARPDEAQLVLPASMHPSAQDRCVSAFAPFNPAGVIFTKIDELIGYGVLINAIEKLSLKPTYLAHGQNVPRDLAPACGRAIADLLFPSREKDVCAQTRPA